MAQRAKLKTPSHQTLVKVRRSKRTIAKALKQAGLTDEEVRILIVFPTIASAAVTAIKKKINKAKREANKEFRAKQKAFLAAALSKLK